MVNKTQDLLNRTAARDLAQKLKYEALFRTDIRKFMSKLADSFKQSYAAHGNSIPANLFKDELNKILLDNYKRISTGFSSQIRMGGKSALESLETKVIDAQIDHQISSYLIKRAGESAKSITKTNQEMIGGFIKKIKVQSIKDQKILSQNDIANQVALLFKANGNLRANIIAATETQNIAEFAKYVEALFMHNIATTRQKLFEIRYNKKAANEDDDFSGIDAALQDIVNPGLPSNTVTKTWVTVLDERTRQAHVIADGQMVVTDKPFNVDGELLLFPGDSSLGASAGNIINCRCSVHYSAEENTANTPVSTPLNPKRPMYTPHELIQNAPKEIPRGDMIQEVDYTPPDGIKGKFGHIRGYATQLNKRDPQNRVLTSDAIKIEPLYMDKGYLPLMDETGKIKLGYLPIDMQATDDVGYFAEGLIDLGTAPGRDAYNQIAKGNIKAFEMVGSAIDKRKLEDGSYIVNTFVVDHIKLSSKKSAANFSRLMQVTPPKAPPIIKAPNPLVYEETTYKNRPVARVAGLANVVNQIDTSGEIITKPVWDDAIMHFKKKKQDEVEMRFRHDKSEQGVIGAFPTSNLISSENGLFAQGYIYLDTEAGRQAFEEVKNGNIIGFSVGTYGGNWNAQILPNLTGKKVDDAIVSKYEVNEISLTGSPASEGSRLLPLSK